MICESFKILFSQFSRRAFYPNGTWTELVLGLVLLTLGKNRKFGGMEIDISKPRDFTFCELFFTL
jgi:hypothetical protein